MTTIRIRGTHRLDDHAHRSAAWMAIATAMVLTLAVLVLMAPRPAAGGGTECPPPSAQLTAAQSGEPPDFTCTPVDETRFITVAPVPVSEPLDVDIIQTPTGTTTQPVPAP